MGSQHFTELVKSDYSHCALLGVIYEKFAHRRCQLNARYIQVTNCQLAKDRKTYGFGSKDEYEDITVGSIKLVVAKYFSTIFHLLYTHEPIWWGELGDTNITKHSIDLILVFSPLNSAPYCPRPENKGTWKSRSALSSGHRRHRTKSVEVGCPSAVCSEERWNTPILCRITSLELYHGKGFVYNPSYGRR